MSTKPDINGTLFLCGADTAAKFLLMSDSVANHLGVRGHRFWFLDAEANVLDEFGPKFDCDCEYSFHTVYEMRDGTLFKYFGKENDCSSDSLRHWKVETVCQVERQFSPDDPEAVSLFAKLTEEEV